MSDTTTNIEEVIKKEGLSLERKAMMFAAALLIIVGGGALAAGYYAVSSSRVYIDKAAIEAPQVALAAPVSGVLRVLYVQEGDVILPGTVVATVGDQLVKSVAGGLVISAENKIGEDVHVGEAIVTTIDPSKLQVVGQIKENKGLDRISVDDRAAFEVDAFKGKTYYGIVSSVAPTSHASGIAFNISDQRATQEFDIKVRFDATRYPELKNGMSARMWVYQQ